MSSAYIPNPFASREPRLPKVPFRDIPHPSVIDQLRREAEEEEERRRRERELYRDPPQWPVPPREYR